MGSTYNYQTINKYNAGMNPSQLHADGTGLNSMLFEYLFLKVRSVLEWTLPDEWDKSYFERWLLLNGYICVLDTPEFGVIPQKGTLQGMNVYGMPSEFMVTNFLLPDSPVRRIGYDGAVIKLNPDYYGVFDLCDSYANLMAQALSTASTGLINSKLAFLFLAENKATAESFKKLYDQIVSGSPMAVVDEKIKLFNPDGTKNWDVFMQNVGQNYITDRALRDFRTLDNEFNTVIGIPNGNTEKRERLITDEVNVNNVETRCLVDLNLDSINEGIRMVKRLFNVDMSVRYRYDDALKIESVESEEDV